MKDCDKIWVGICVYLGKQKNTALIRRSDPRLKHVLFKLLITCSLINKTKEDSAKMLKRLRIRIFTSQLHISCMI